MTDAASLYSTTSTLVDVPDLRDSGLLPPDDCFAILLIHHDRFKADVEQLTRAGLPSTFGRISLPSTPRLGLGKLNPKKRLQVQFPRALLQARVDRREDFKTLEEVAKMRASKASTAGKRMTLFETLEDDLVCLHTRRILDIALAMLFQGRDLHSPTLYYPLRSVRNTPLWAAGRGGNFATAPAQWATLTFLSPSPDGEDKIEPDAQSRFLESLKNVETNEQVLERLSAPDQSSRELLQALLSHLESRGALWSRAGQITVPSIKNAHPRRRPEFAVLGLFPEVSVPMETSPGRQSDSSAQPFASRCKMHYRNGRCLTADIREDAKSKHAPLIVDPHPSTAKHHRKHGGSCSRAQATDGTLTAPSLPPPPLPTR